MLDLGEQMREDEHGGSRGGDLADEAAHLPGFFWFSSRRRHTISDRDWSSDVCSSDLRELAAQVTEEFEYVSAGRLRIASVYGGVPLKPQAEIAKQAHVIVATPGRLQDLSDRKLISIAD